MLSLFIDLCPEFSSQLSWLQSISSHTAGEVQLTQQDCPAELLYTQTQDGVEPKQTTLILRQSTGSMAVSKTERNRTMTIKDKYALLSAPLTSVGKQRNFETIYDEAIENLENDPLQSSVIVRKIDQEGYVAFVNYELNFID